MEVIVVLLLLVFLLVVINAMSGHRKSQESLERKLDYLLRETAQLQKDLATLLKEGLNTSAASSAKDAPVVKPVFVPRPAPPAEPFAKPAPPKETVSPSVPVQRAEPPKPTPAPAPPPRESWWETWLRANPDLEKFIGENLINKIGIAILVLGIAFFVKYAIDKDWINEAGRVCIGLACGGLLVGLAHYLRNSYRSFSSVLAGGGIAVFYFSIAFAFHQYGLFSQTAAFGLMVVITGFAVALSLLYNKLELAVIATVGGFITPFLVSTGQGNYVVLFTYLIILNTGLLALSFFKRWTLINVLAFVFTEIIFGGWLFRIEREGGAGISYPLALLFASVLYALFLGMNTAYQSRYKQPFRALDFALLLWLNASCFAAGLALLSHIEAGAFRGLFTLGIGLVNLVLAWIFFKRPQEQKNLLYLLIGLTLTFLTLTVPVQLHGHAITLFWTVEPVLLLWLYQRSAIRVFWYASLLVMAAGLVSLGMDWMQAALYDSEAIVLLYSNLQGLVTNAVAAASFAAYALLLKKGKDAAAASDLQKTLLTIAAVIGVVIAYLTALFGVNLFFRHAAGYEAPNVYHRLVTEAVVAVGLILLRRRYSNRSTGWGVAAVAGYLLYHLLSISLVTGLRNGVLAQNIPAVHLAFHWVSTAAALILVYAALQPLPKAPLPHVPSSRLGLVASIALLIFFSQEAAHVFIALFYKGNIAAGEEQYGKAVLTIVWGLCSFGAMWLGMRHKSRPLRIVSLSIFALALLKLFFFDLAGMSEGGRIAAFILLGVLLLTISFMYQKLKKIIIDERP